MPSAHPRRTIAQHRRDEPDSKPPARLERADKYGFTAATRPVRISSVRERLHHRAAHHELNVVERPRPGPALPPNDSQNAVPKAEDDRGAPNRPRPAAAAPRLAQGGRAPGQNAMNDGP